LKRAFSPNDHPIKNWPLPENLWRCLNEEDVPRLEDFALHWKRISLVVHQLLEVGRQTLFIQTSDDATPSN